MYAGKNGDVYRKDSSGSWQKYENGGWSDTGPKPTPHAQNAALTRGTQAQQRLQVQPTDLLLHNSRQSLRGQFNSSIETLRHAKQERSGHGSTSDRSAQAGNRVEGARGADDRNES